MKELHLTRRTALAASLGFPYLLHGGAHAATSAEPVAETTNGKVRGVRDRGVEVYRGVPYGGSVSGANRFRHAPPVTPWAGILDATRPGAPSIQPGPISSAGVAPSEDCLTLTVWTPAADGRRRPVMFYCHGGGFVTGSGSSVMQDGANVARLYDVVVVATNHRLGLLGYLYLDEIAGPDYAGSGNNGLLDIVAGLRWIHENVERFGGDPSNVMVFGESGGGAKTSCLYAMPQAAPYFHRASIESGPGIKMLPKDIAQQKTRQVLKALEISPQDWRRLLDTPTETLLKVQATLPSGSGYGGSHGFDVRAMGLAPVVDGVALPADPFDPSAPAFSKDKPLICGHNHDEASFFAMIAGDVSLFNLDWNGLDARLQKELPGDYNEAIDIYRGSRPMASAADIYIAIQSDNFAGAGAATILERKVRQGGAPAYGYVFNYALERTLPGAQRSLGPMHALDIPFKFNNVDHIPAVGVLQNFISTRPERHACGDNMSGLWATFARTGRPGVSGQPIWPAYNLTDRPLMVIDAQCEVKNDPFAAERKFWEARAQA